jgi:hypothetical protein
MPQLSKGDTFADQQQLTATRLNQLVDSATLLVGAISEQTAITANSLESTDTTIVNDSGTLKKATIGDIVGSGVPVITTSVTSTANNDITLTANDGTSVTGSTYISTDGITVTVTTLAAHGLSVNNVITISSAGTGYNGSFRVSAVTTNTFQYVLATAATATPSATACTYIRKATVINTGNNVVTGNVFVNNEIQAPTIKSTTSAEFNLSTTKTNNVTTASRSSNVTALRLVAFPLLATNGRLLQPFLALLRQIRKCGLSRSIFLSLTTLCTPLGLDLFRRIQVQYLRCSTRTYRRSLTTSRLR